MSQGSRPTILVVDDEADVRESLSFILELNGYDVISAANGLEALEHLRTGIRPRLILLDLMMPVMDGWEFWEGLRTNQELESIPVIIMTAHKVRNDPRFEGVKLLPKPFDASSLLQALAESSRQ
jgi:two-component system, chemotaxis family, chemotaxis protein CheY